MVGYNISRWELYIYTLIFFLHLKIKREKAEHTYKRIFLLFLPW